MNKNVCVRRMRCVRCKYNSLGCFRSFEGLNDCMKSISNPDMSANFPFL